MIKILKDSLVLFDKGIIIILFCIDIIIILQHISQIHYALTVEYSAEFQ